MRFRVGFRPVIEADEWYLLGGRMVEDGPVFERFCEALYYFNVVIALNESRSSSEARQNRTLSREGELLNDGTRVTLREATA
jgi:hypothetical protein